MATDRKEVPQHYYSLDEYFALEHAGHVRYEYWDGEIVCMSGGSLAHGRLCGNVFFHLRRRSKRRAVPHVHRRDAGENPHAPALPLS